MASYSCITPWTAFTPTGTFTNTTYSGLYRRLGTTAHYQVLASCTGTPAGATFAVNVLTPLGLTLDTAALLGSVGDGTTPMGRVLCYDDSTSTVHGSTEAMWRTTNAGVVGLRGATATHISALMTQAIPFTFAVNDAVFMRFYLPILGW